MENNNMEVTIHISYTVVKTKEASALADKLFHEFDEKFKSEFPDAKLNHTYISKLRDEEKITKE